MAIPNAVMTQRSRPGQDELAARVAVVPRLADPPVGIERRRQLRLDPALGTAPPS